VTQYDGLTRRDPTEQIRRNPAIRRSDVLAERVEDVVLPQQVDPGSRRVVDRACEVVGHRRLGVHGIAVDKNNLARRKILLAHPACSGDVQEEVCTAAESGDVVPRTAVRLARCIPIKPPPIEIGI
jgi:hypothetical protein